MNENIKMSKKYHKMSQNQKILLKVVKKIGTHGELGMHLNLWIFLLAALKYDLP